MQQSKSRWSVGRLLPAMLLLWTVSLMGCATKLLDYAQSCPRIPEKPALQEQMPSLGYLKPALENIEAWRKKLRDISTTP